ncbi:hypothetical protein [Variovorax fucosicus]|uniref:hypothetical protein n=1 Tax=Variovorax fucosicus TaxID=3053517 RepID=UPI002575BAD4|nr:hypothetical protein [Variovorax sp. J22G47]MDM0056905.1 hypothetical protein [Variovorax sp. J22G47]
MRQDPHAFDPPSPRLLWLVAVILMIILSSGCSSKEPYRISGRNCEVPEAPKDKDDNYLWEAKGADGRPCGDAWQVSIAKPVPFTVNFVEFDDQGVFANRRQAEAAIANAVKSEAEGSYVVVFVHGWHHRAKTGDGNVQGFYDALASVSRWNPTRKIKGIYVGWRGESVDVPFVNNLTFWDRKGTSDEVGRGALLEFLLRLEHEVKMNPQDNNKLVLIGHSFGASVTFNALAHVYLSRFLDGIYSSDSKPRFRGYGDLVVLVNPAIEAMRYMPFQSALDYYSRISTRPRLDFSHEMRPSLVVLSSTTDFPTRRLFPAGRVLTTAFETHARVSESNSPDNEGAYVEWNMDIKTVGNFWNFQTHATIELAAADPGAAQQAPEKDLAAGLRDSCKPVAPAELRRLLNQPEGAATADHFPDSRIRIRRLAGQGIDGSPYIVAAVDEKIVDGHNDIGGLNLVCWINQLLDTRESTPAPAIPKQQNPAVDYKARS